MKKIRVRDREFSLFLSKENITKAVDQVAEMINAELAGTDPIFLCVLNGALSLHPTC